MRKAILAALAIVASSFALAQPAHAADYMGKLLDGGVFRAIVYSNQGAEFAAVTFVRDEARVLLYDGETLIVNLNNSEIVNPHFIGGKSLDGHFYRIDVDDASFLFGTEILPMIGQGDLLGGCIPGPDGFMHCAHNSGAPDMFFSPGFGGNGNLLFGGGHMH